MDFTDAMIEEFPFLMQQLQTDRASQFFAIAVKRMALAWVFNKIAAAEQKN